MLAETDIRSRRRAARRGEIAERILPSIAQLIETEGGFNSVTITQILRASGLPRSTFYRHFDDKIDVFLAIGVPVLSSVVASAVRPWELAADMTRVRLETELGRTVRGYVQHVGLLRAMSEMASADERVRRQFESAFGQVQRAVARSLRRGQAAGYIRPELYPEETAGWITWMAERGMTHLAASADDRTRARLVSSLADIVWLSVFELQTDSTRRST